METNHHSEGDGQATQTADTENRPRGADDRPADDRMPFGALPFRPDLDFNRVSSTSSHCHQSICKQMTLFHQQTQGRGALTERNDHQSQSGSGRRNAAFGSHSAVKHVLVELPDGTIRQSAEPETAAQARPAEKLEKVIPFAFGEKVELDFNTPSGVLPQRSDTRPTAGKGDKEKEKDGEKQRKQLEEAEQRLEKLKQEVDQFDGRKGDIKQYRSLDAQLERLMLTLDGVETEGDAKLRTQRKEMIRKVQVVVAKLDDKSPDKQKEQISAPPHHQHQHEQAEKADVRSAQIRTPPIASPRGSKATSTTCPNSTVVAPSDNRPDPRQERAQLPDSMQSPEYAQEKVPETPNSDTPCHVTPPNTNPLVFGLAFENVTGIPNECTRPNSAPIPTGERILGRTHANSPYPFAYSQNDTTVRTSHEKEEEHGAPMAEGNSPESHDPMDVQVDVEVGREPENNDEEQMDDDSIFADIVRRRGC